MKIEWTDSAKEDVVQIRHYLKAHHSPEYASKVIKAIRDEVGSLKAQQHKGTYVAELQELHMPSFRQLLAGQNRIIVEHTADVCYVHIVCHTSMNLKSLLMKRLVR